MTDVVPLTMPDGRYIFVRGRLWRRAKPNLTEAERSPLTRELMDARRAIGRIKRAGAGNSAAARGAVERAKIALGERGPVWWDDGTPDYTRRMARNTPYAIWYSSFEGDVWGRLEHHHIRHACI